jgi:hypothetical protein
VPETPPPAATVEEEEDKRTPSSATNTSPTAAAAADASSSAYVLSEAELLELRLFDLNMTFGPCVGACALPRQIMMAIA